MPAPPDERRQFQVDRLAYFSDAVFAIAITLLALNIHAPVIAQSTEALLLQSIAQMVPGIIGFVLSFFVVSNYWRAHHRLFRWVNDYDDKLVSINLLLLLVVSFIPCPTAFYSDHPAFQTPLIFYCASLGVVGLLHYALSRYIGHHPDLLRADAPLVELKLARRRALLIPVVCVFAVAASFADLWLARAMLMLIPVFMRVYTRVARRMIR